MAKKRLMVNLEPKLHKLMMTYSKAAGASASSIIEMMIAESEPAIKRMIAIFEELKLEPKKALEQMQGVLLEKEAEIRQASLQLGKDKALLRGPQGGRPRKKKVDPKGK